MGSTAADRADTSTALTAAGRPIHVDPADRRGDSLVQAHGDLNPPSRVLWHLALRLHDWEVVADVGANYGEMLVGAPIPDRARVVGFEPNTGLHPYLERTCVDNGIDLELHGTAVSDRAGSGALAVDGQWSGTSTLTPPEDADPGRWRLREVPVTTLDACLGGADAWCAKVDVEGHELAVVRGASAAMARAGHWAMVLEVLHLSAHDVARLAHAHPLYLMDRRTETLVRVPGAHVALARTMLGSGWLYPQDCLLVSPAVRDLVEA
jgi:FkbM family methyltransferase